MQLRPADRIDDICHGCYEQRVEPGHDRCQYCRLFGDTDVYDEIDPRDIDLSELED